MNQFSLSVFLLLKISGVLRYNYSVKVKAASADAWTVLSDEVVMFTNEDVHEIAIMFAAPLGITRPGGA